MRTCFGALACGLALVLVACSGETEPASTIQPTSATLNLKGTCAFATSGTWRFQYKPVSASTWQDGPAHDFSCPPGSSGTENVPLPGDTITGLTPGTRYEYRLAADLDPPGGGYVYADSLGANGTSYDSFTTPENCDDTQGAAETLAALIASNPAGTAANRQVLCVRGGTQDIGQVSVKAYQTIRGPSENLLNGNISMQAQGATLEDLRVAGCLTGHQAGCTATINKAVDIKANDLTLRRVDVTQQGGRNAAPMQCVLMGSASVRVSGFRAEYSRFHGCGAEASANHDHGIYCSNAAGPVFVGNWLYDNEGWGFHLYPDCDDAVVEGNVNAENGNACALSGESNISGWPTSDRASFRNGFCGFARESNSSDYPIHCFDNGNGSALDMVLYDPERASVTDCGSLLTQTNTLNADPQFVNRTGYDFRVRNAAARSRMRQYADNQPGPRW